MKKKAGQAGPPEPPGSTPRKKEGKRADYAALAERAFLALDYRQALSWALKALGREPGHRDLQLLALACAEVLQDKATVLLLLNQMYQDGALATKEDCLLLARMALAERDYKAAAAVYQALLEDAASGKPRLKGRLTKARLKEIEQGLRYARLMLEQSSPGESPAAEPLGSPKFPQEPVRESPRPRKVGPPGTPWPVSGKQPPAPPDVKKTRVAKSRAPARQKAKEPATARPKTRAEAKPAPAAKPAPPKKVKAEAPPAKPSPEAVPAPPPVPPEPLPELEVVYETNPGPVLEALKSRRRSQPEMVESALKAYRLSFRTSYDQLLCLPTLQDVRSLWYQEETARKVMRSFRGRAILADEVGLGKTIEAGLILKEYLLRGLVQTALVLTPSSLVRQWQEELAGKFGLTFVSTQDELFRRDPERFWAEPFILASLQTVRSQRHFSAVTSRTYDLVVVDEAHHLKNRATRNWKLVNAIQKTFLLLLTATPVQNSLEELYNLVTLLRPGHLKTLKSFKAEFVTRGNPTDPRNREKLRELLKEVMVRNTRAVTQLRLPPRFAVTVRLSPTPEEGEFYQRVSRLVTAQAGRPDTRGGDKLVWRRLLEAAGSSPAAALRMLSRLQERQTDGLGEEINDLMALGRSIRKSAKVQKVVDLLKASSEQKLLFVNYLASLEYVQQALDEHGIPHVVYQGSLTPAQKQAALQTFRDGCPVLLATGTGGEGHNLQFCQVMLNYDLPWNPMEIEQRIGRLHRIGQEKEVQVYNFCAAGSIEDHILEVLDKKINMFELVVGEIDMILGRLEDEVEFGDLVYDLWVRHPDESARREAFEALDQRLRQARVAYERSKELDEKLFQDDFGV